MLFLLLKVRFLPETSLLPRLSHSAAFVDRKEFWVLISYIYIPHLYVHMCVCVCLCVCMQ